MKWQIIWAIHLLKWFFEKCFTITIPNCTHFSKMVSNKVDTPTHIMQTLKQNITFSGHKSVVLKLFFKFERLSLTSKYINAHSSENTTQPYSPAPFQQPTHWNRFQLQPTRSSPIQPPPPSAHHRAPLEKKETEKTRTTWKASPDWRRTGVGRCAFSARNPTCAGQALRRVCIQRRAIIMLCVRGELWKRARGGREGAGARAIIKFEFWRRSRKGAVLSCILCWRFETWTSRFDVNWRKECCRRRILGRTASRTVRKGELC